MEKVYLVYNEYYDYSECDHNSVLLGIYSSMDAAREARNEFVDYEFADGRYGTQRGLDADNHPVVTKFLDGEPVEDNVFTIEEWSVQ